MTGDVPRRVRLLPWALLVVTDLVALTMLARCFSGPGELVLALPTCLAVHLLAGGGRRLAAKRWAVARAAAAGPQGADHPAVAPGAGGTRRYGALTALGWALALVVAFLVPLAGVDGDRFSVVLPLGPAWHAVSGQLAVAWRIFSDKVAPVAETPGLVLVTAWASGAVALASEVLYADAGLPAVLALVPAFDVVVFAGTLGTTTGRAIELAVVAASGLSFLTSAQGDRRPDRTVVRARAASSIRDREGPAAASGPARQMALPGIALAAALAGGVIGPFIPGATSAPLVAWHGLAVRKGKGGPGAGGVHGHPNKIFVSDLVQVAEQEVQDTSALLFTVHSSERVRETLLTLDHFNGNAWSRTPASEGRSEAVAGFGASLAKLARRPPKPVELGDGVQSLDQLIQISGLGGELLPTPGITVGVDGLSGVARLGTDGPTSVLEPLTAELSYGIRAILPATSASAELLAAAPPASELPAPGTTADLQLPGPVPAALKRLAASIVGGATDPFVKAERLQNYFLTGRFTYHLPTFAPSGAIADQSQTYRALEAFLFSNRTGYCQQFATAFAVLARIEDLPTRIAIGFLPGKEVGHDEYLVTGAQVHAWPEVNLGSFGWVTFEPTPGVLRQGITPPPTTGHRGGPGPTATTQPLGPGDKSRFRITDSKAPPTPRVAGHLGAHHLRQPAGSSGLADLVLALAALALAWAVGVPSWRWQRRRRDRRDASRAPVTAWVATTWMLAAAGAHRRRAETHLEFVDRVRRLGLLNAEALAALERLARSVDRALYSRSPAGGSAADAAWSDAAAVRRAIRRKISWWQKISVVLDPRDLLGAP
ncbi:MAG TPA: transglutaminase-like domain-containing protein [Acidimicrobiales bacterium]|nr:transglutaminase-like domain-containing protein [Acidimicrobiales bacterium]